MADTNPTQSKRKPYRKAPPEAALTKDQAYATLKRIFLRLVALSPNQIDLQMLDPVVRAAFEVQNKLVSSPDELWRSSKLYRAIDDIESTALHMPQHRANAPELADLSQELRGLTGWTAAD
ncbi:MAG: hypothetical protein K2Y02_03675 [Burkholderiaceae bacterium]|nr:hypothetical protein [Burkholderiaceae bacterium]